MRRFVLVLGLVLAGAGVLLFSGCSQPNNVLRVASINAGMPVKCDIADWALFNDPQIPDSEEDFNYIYEIPNDAVEIEFQYVQVGAGLPTVTPYHALITEYTITYEEGSQSYSEATIPTWIDVPADYTAKNSTKVTLALATSWWKLQSFGDDIGDAPSEETTPIDVVLANIEFSAVDSVLGKPITAKAAIQMQFGDFYDNPQQIGN